MHASPHQQERLSVAYPNNEKYGQQPIDSQDTFS